MLYFFLYMVLIIFSLILTFGYLFTWVMFHKYQFLERNPDVIHQHPEYETLWHFWKAFQQLIWFIFFYLVFDSKITLLNLAFFWLMFDALLNKLVLNRSMFYVSQTSTIDIIIRKTANIFHATPELFIGILKIGFLFYATKNLF